MKVLAKLFRGKLREALIRGFASGALKLPVDVGADILDRLREAFRADWVVYAKAPFGGAEQVYAYLGRYTHRVGISNARIQTMDDRGVTFATKGGGHCTLSGVEFLRRFVDHVLPKGFTRIRHYGLLAASHATTTLERARALLTPPIPVSPATDATPTTSTTSTAPSTWIDILLTLTGLDARRCPCCETGSLLRVPLPEASTPAGRDTS